MYFQILFKLSNKKKGKSKKIHEKSETNIEPTETLQPNENGWRMEIKQNLSAVTKEESPVEDDLKIQKNIKKDKEK